MVKYTLNAGGHAPTYFERKPLAWSPAYHSDYLKSLTTSYLLLQDEDLVVSWIGGSVSKTRGKIVSWDSSKTTVNGARLVISAVSDIWGAEFTVSFNGFQLFKQNIGSMSQQFDILPLLENGFNGLMVTAYRSVGGATITVTASLEIDFVGVDPDVKDPFGWDWPSWWPYAAMGIVMAVVGGIIIWKKR